METANEHKKTLRRSANNSKPPALKVQAYSSNMSDATSDHDMELAFKIAKALGTDTLTTLCHHYFHEKN